jgi:ABC-type long-subunit fatty acid transport system fused permease/ATPase subunit
MLGARKLQEDGLSYAYTIDIFALSLYRAISSIVLFRTLLPAFSHPIQSLVFT